MTGRLFKIYKSRWFVPLYIVLLISIFISLSLIESSKENVTIDERVFITSGLRYLHDHNLQTPYPEPPVIPVSSALSARLFAKTDYNSSATITRGNAGDLLYLNTGRKAQATVFWARLPVVLISALLPLLLFLWGKELISLTAGLAALTLFCLDPSMIAFSHLVTFDLPMATFTTMAVYLMWKAARDNSKKYFVLSGLAFGAAMNIKVTALVFLLIVPLMIWPYKEKGPIKTKLIEALQRLALTFTPALILTWIIYFAVYGSEVFHSFGIIPHEYITAIKHGSFSYNLASHSFIWGHLYNEAQWWYIPATMLIKLPLILIILFVIGVLTIAKKRQYKTDLGFFVLLPLSILFLLILPASINIGLRYGFIFYPFIFLLAGLGFYQITRVKIKKIHVRLILGAAVVYYVISLWIFFPNYLTYANELGGSKSGGYRNLANSDIDWSQGLMQLRSYTEKSNIEDIEVFYWGDINPKYFGFRNYVYSDWGSFQDKLRLVQFNSRSAGPLVVVKVGTEFHEYLNSLSGPVAVPVTLMNYGAQHDYNYEIAGKRPATRVANYLIYNLP